jgi:hypothetical protein
MRHPALRRSARHNQKREMRIAANNAANNGPQPSSNESRDPAGQNRPVPNVPPDGDHNQGGARPEGLDYQRDLGSEQDA